MSLRMFDYRCRDCGRQFEEMVNVSSERDGNFAKCSCGGVADKFWKKAPGVRGDGNVDAHMMRAARSGITYGTDGQKVSTFRGSTRGELRAWMRRHNLVAVDRSEINSRGVTINTKTKFTETEEFKRKHERVMTEAMEIAKAGDEAVQNRLAGSEKPNEFDDKAFAQQTAAGVAAIAADADTKKVAAGGIQ